MASDGKRIVFCCDGNKRQREMLDYAIQSIQRVAVSQCQITVVSDAEYTNGEWVDARKYIEQFGLNELIAGMKYLNGGQITPMCFMRLYIPFMDEFSTDSLVLYLDTDVEIVDRAFLDIFDLPITAEVGAVKEPFQVSKWRAEKLQESLPDFPENIVYGERVNRGEIYNSGIMLMNLAALRRRASVLPSLYDTAIRVLKQRKVRGWDQNIVNLILDVQELPSNHNCVCGWEHSGKPLCLHYPGRNKLVGKYPPQNERTRILKEAK